MRSAPPTSRSRRRGPAASAVLISIVLALAVLAPGVTACSRSAEHAESRPLLGTVVSVAAYGADKDMLEDAVASAFDELGAVELAADAYEPDSPIARINRYPYAPHFPPPSLRQVGAAVERLDVTPWFDVRLWGVSVLYDFGDDGIVPPPELLDASLSLAGTATWPPAGLFRFTEPATGTALPDPGIDLGGAAKGLAADMARLSLAGDPSVTGALIDAGSTTVAVGTKPDGSPWRIGIEDPRQDGRIVAVIRADAGAAVSTSGDYQQYFERGGTRYHHILDPATGRPANGVRSVTVACDSALDADILSTALFVAGVDEALAYARAHGIAMYLVDGEGRAHTVPGPDDSGIRIEQIEDPLP